MEPRTPQKITLVLEACTLLIEDRINCDTQTMSDQEFLHGAIHGSLLAVISKPHRGYWALLAAAWIWAIWSCAEYWREMDIALSRNDLSSDPVVVESFPCSPNPGPTQLSRCANALEPRPCAWLAMIHPSCVGSGLLRSRAAPMRLLCAHSSDWPSHPAIQVLRLPANNVLLSKCTTFPPLAPLRKKRSLYIRMIPTRRIESLITICCLRKMRAPTRPKRRNWWQSIPIASSSG